MRSWMIGTIAGIMPVSLLANLPSIKITGLFFVISVVLLFLSRRKRVTFASGIFGGIALAIGHGHALVDSRISRDCEGERLQVQGIVASLPRSSISRYGKPNQKFNLDVTSLTPFACVGPKLIQMTYYGDRPIRPGQQWQFDSKLKRPWGLVNPGSFNIQAWYAQNRIDAVASVLPNTDIFLGNAVELQYQHHRIRSAVSSRIAKAGLSPDSHGVLRALTVADKSGVDDQLWQLFQAFGLNHLLAISGLHIGLVAGLGLGLGAILSRVVSVLGYQRYVVFLPHCVAAVFAIAYAALAGFSLPTNRAVMMLSVFLIAPMFSRRSSSWNNLLIAAFMVLVVNPLQILGSGFWLSFVAVAWLLWLNMWLPSQSLILRLLSVHFAMSLVMFPLGGFWFGGASAVSALANFCLIPLVGFFVVPLALLGASACWFSQELGDVLFRLAAWPLDLLIPLAQQLVELKRDAFYHPFYTSLPSLLLALLGLFLLASRALPNSWLVSLVFCTPLLLSRGGNRIEDDYLAKLTVLDVGQGTAVIFSDGARTLVYDTGGGNPQGRNLAQTVVIPFLRRENIQQLETLVVSHGDNDHSAGANELVSKLPVQKYFSGAASDQPLVDGPAPCIAGKAWQWSTSVRFQFLSPAFESGLSSNNGSCVLQISVGDTKVLLTGDIDRHREKSLVQYWRSKLHSEWMLAPHHGSNSSSSRPWLKYVQAKTIVFSSGYRNAFGHPHNGVIERVENGNTSLYSTSRDGAIEFVLEERGIGAVTRHRKEYSRYWF
ncbi:MAG: DNA internalization-related competence protein ComEC/Rec2 [Halioglobus sp.]